MAICYLNPRNLRTRKMEKLSKIGRYQFLAEPFHCDFTNHLFMGHLGNHMLNAADFHSNERGYGMNYLNTINKTWVLSRLAIEMYDMPKAYEKFYVETWVDSVMKYFTSRNFKVVNEEGHVYGYGKSIWAMIDMDTRQPTDIFAVREGLINEYIETSYECPIEKFSRVKVTGEEELLRSINTYYNDVDVNGHINSVKYIEHLLDLWDLDWYRTHFIKRFEIAYVAEAHHGDQLNFYREHREKERENDFNFKITKTTSDNAEVETCRCRVLFSSKD